MFSPMYKRFQAEQQPDGEAAAAILNVIKELAAERADQSLPPAERMAINRRLALLRCALRGVMP